MIGHLVNRKLTAHRPSVSDDGAGGQEVEFTQVGKVNVQASQPSAQEVRTAAQWGAELTHVLHASYGSDIRRGDELDGDLPSDVPASRRLRVISVVSNSRATYTRISCEITQAEEG